MKYKLSQLKSIILILGVVFLTAILTSYFYILPSIVNIEKYRPEIKSFIKEKVLYPVELGDLAVEFTWKLGIRIKADKALLKKHDGSKFAYAGPSYVEIFLPGLLNKKVFIQKVNITGLDASVERLPNGEFDILNILAKRKKQRYKVKIKNTDILINGCKVSFYDNYMKPARFFVFSGKSLAARKFTPDKYINLSINGQLSAPNISSTNLNITYSSELPVKNSRKTVLKGSIDNLALTTFKSYFNKYGPFKFLKLDGVVKSDFDIDINKTSFLRKKFRINTELDGIDIETEKEGRILKHDELLSLYAKGFYDSKILYIEDFRTNGQDIDLRAYGRVDNYKNKKTRILDLSFDIGDSRAEAIAKVFPKNIRVSKSPFRKILKHNIKSKISGNFRIKGAQKSPELFGSIKYRDFSMLEENPEVPKSSGIVNFIGDKIAVYARHYINRKEIVSINGEIAPFKKKEINLNVVTNNVDFVRTQKFLFVFSDLFVFKVGPVVDMELGGRGRVNLNISGPFKDSKLNGYIGLENAKIKYATLSAPAYDINGKLLFMGEKVVYDEVNGFVEGSEIQPSGYSTLKGYSDVNLAFSSLGLKKGLAVIRKSPLLEAAKESLKDIRAASGTADALINLKGEKDNIAASGEFLVKKAYLSYRGFGEPFYQVKGKLRFDDGTVYFDDITGRVAQSRVSLKGSINEKEEAEITVSSKYLNLASARRFLMKSKIVEDIKPVLNEYSEIKGVSSVKANIKGNLNEKPFKDLTIDFIDATAVHKYIGLPVMAKKGQVVITDEKINFKKVKAFIAGNEFSLDGYIPVMDIKDSNKIKSGSDFSLSAKKFNLAKLPKIQDIPIVPDHIKKKFAQLNNFGGFAKVDFVVTPKTFYFGVDADNISATYIPYDLPVNIVGGKAEISDKNLKISDLMAKIFDSSIEIGGFINNYNNSPTFDLYGSAGISSDDIETLKLSVDIPVKSKGVFPLGVSVKGTLDNWKALARMVVNQGDYFNYLVDIGLPRNKVRILTLDADGSRANLDINRLRVDFTDQYSENLLNKNLLSQINDNMFNLINIYGGIDKLNTKNPLFNKFNIRTAENNISTRVFNPSLKFMLNTGNEQFLSDGNFKANIILNGPVIKPEIIGMASFYGLKMPDYKMSVDGISFNFNNDEITINAKNLLIGNSDLNITAVMDAVFDVPVLIKDIKVNSSYLDIDELSAILRKGSPKNDSVLPPFVVTNGEFNSRELIIRNLLASNIQTKFNLTPDWLLSLPEIRLTTAGGYGVGNLYNNLKTSEVSATFNVKSMQANALATTLLNMPNEVYGTLDGDFQFVSRGRNSEELIANSNGYAEFQIMKGRLVRLGSLEYLLRAVNVLQSGVGGFNLNNVIDLIAPQKTGYFEYLKGKISSKDGVLNTDEIMSSGKNLSLFISGRFDMLTNNSDITVLGRMSKKVSGLLGPVGSVSINQFIDYVPGLGFLPVSPGEKGLIDIVPGLSKIPGLELSGKEKFRRFAVDIKGDLYDPGSVRTFRWVE